MHLSAGDLLRAELNRGGANAQLINQYIAEGKIVPIHITVQLLKNAMEDAGWDKCVFLIDGFPRNEENRTGFNEVFEGKIEFLGVIYLNVSEECMTARIEERSKTSGRVDDNLQTLVKRFASFRNEQLPIIKYFASQGKVLEVNAEQTPEKVYSDVKDVVNAAL